MSYNMDTHPNAPYEFPPPPPFLVWVAGWKWDPKTGTHAPTSEGQVRHISDLSKAKARVRNCAKPHRYFNPLNDHEAFRSDWAIYYWNVEKGEYELQYDGKAGEKIANNPLFKTTIRKGKKHQPRPGLEDEVEKALQSIAKVIQ